MENKQTAVEWLIEQIIKYGLVPQGTNPDNVLFHKAKLMEKENSLDAFFAGYNYEGGYPIDEHDDYYNKAYEK
jgi:hypothetical protein